MNKETTSPEENLNEKNDSVVKKIIVPVALTVGLLGNSSQADLPSSVSAHPTMAEITSSDMSGIDYAPVDLNAGEDDEDEDEEKRAYKGKNLASSSLGAAPAVLTGAVESISQGAISPLIAFGAEFIGVFAVLSVLFLGMFKAIYPMRKINEMITPKNITRILIASIIICFAFYAADSLSSQKNIFLELGKNGIILAAILILWFKIFELKGKFGKVMRDLFWGNKGKWMFIALIVFNIIMSILHIVYNTFLTSNSFTTLTVFYIISIFTVFGIYELCKGRMVEDDEYENKL